VDISKEKHDLVARYGLETAFLDPTLGPGTVCWFAHTYKNRWGAQLNSVNQNSKYNTAVL
jgi:hypothetical protein